MKKIHLSVLSILVFNICGYSQQLAFPEAEGWFFHYPHNITFITDHAPRFDSKVFSISENWIQSKEKADCELSISRIGFEERESGKVVVGFHCWPSFQTPGARTWEVGKACRDILWSWCKLPSRLSVLSEQVQFVPVWLFHSTASLYYGIWDFWLQVFPCNHWR